MTRWEYTQATVRVDGVSSEPIASQWYELLNQLGAEGWELVSERYYWEGGTGHAAYDGTMKRPSTSLWLVP